MPHGHSVAGHAMSNKEDDDMGALLLVLLLALILGGVGFAIHILWWVAIVVLVLWVLGFVFRGSGGGRWYRW
jgi:hypothetical protein